MLSPQHRLRSSDDFRSTIRNGKRVGGRYVVIHVSTQSTRETRVGFVVSKAIGNAVNRNRVKRQLRHAMREELECLNTPVDVVIRALPKSRDAGFSVLQHELRRGLIKAGVHK